MYLIREDELYDKSVIVIAAYVYKYLLREKSISSCFEYFMGQEYNENDIILSIDWLFLTGKIKGITEEGEIIL